MRYLPEFKDMAARSVVGGDEKAAEMPFAPIGHEASFTVVAPPNAEILWAPTREPARARASEAPTGLDVALSIYWVAG